MGAHASALSFSGCDSSFSILHALRHREEVFENRLREAGQVRHIFRRWLVQLVRPLVSEQTDLVTPILEGGRKFAGVGEFVDARSEVASDVWCKSFQADVYGLPVAHRCRIEVVPFFGFARLDEDARNFVGNVIGGLAYRALRISHSKWLADAINCLRAAPKSVIRQVLGHRHDQSDARHIAGCAEHKQRIWPLPRPTDAEDVHCDLRFAMRANTCKGSHV